MDSSSRHASRIAYSFPRDTFDLRRLCPFSCFDTKGGTATAVQLDNNWPLLLESLSELGLMMVSAARGPVSMAMAWERPVLGQFPGSPALIHLDTSAEIYPEAICEAMAVVETAEDQQMASFQFFDRRGEGCLKILVTDWSDMEAFESIVVAHADQPRPSHHLSRARPPRVDVLPDAEAVRALWHGLSRSLPESHFPGLPGVTRLAALQVAGPQRAWRVPRRLVRHALSLMARQRGVLGGAVRNDVIFHPVCHAPLRWNEHGCGVTWHGEDAQLTLRGCCAPGETWVTRFERGGNEALCLEFFNEHQDFCGAIGLRSECEEWHYETWQEILRGAAPDIAS